MNFSSMEYFVTLAQERSFTKAADRLHITQQTLSTHIANLENELGSKLIVRHIPLELTFAGTVFLRYASGFQRDRSRLEREFCDITQNQKGLLRIGIAFTRGRTILPRVIVAFQKEYPNITVELSEASNDVLHQMLLNGEIDIGIADFPDSFQGITLKDYYREEIVLLIARSLFTDLLLEKSTVCEKRLREGDLSVLKDFPFLLESEKHIEGKIGRRFLSNAGIVLPFIKATSSNMTTLLELCVLGSGACFCPENLARAVLTKKQFDDLLLLRLGKEAVYQIRFGYHSDEYQWSVMDAFMDCARHIIH